MAGSTSLEKLLSKVASEQGRAEIIRKAVTDSLPEVCSQIQAGEKLDDAAREALLKTARDVLEASTLSEKEGAEKEDPEQEKPEEEGSEKEKQKKAFEETMTHGNDRVAEKKD